jgi:para-aminobenzoate synthetase component 1
MDRDAYASAFRRIQRYIRDGDCYQVNLAQRFQAIVAGDPWQIYRALRRVNPAPFGAYLSCADFQVLSASPERFLSVREGTVNTEPIKGTRPRSADPDRDRALADELRASPKDRAENLMIVDLLRNDLGRNCRPGSIAVPHLFDVRSFATVHHMVSTVTGTLDAGRDAIDLLAGCFPGGSVTGAPKLRAMEIIEELEPHRRGVYCGAIGYIGFDGAMDTSIAIRTLVHDRGRLSFSAGGGGVPGDLRQGRRSVRGAGYGHREGGVRWVGSPKPAGSRAGRVRGYTGQDVLQGFSDEEVLDCRAASRRGRGGVFPVLVG